MLFSTQTMSRESSSTITPPEPAIDPAAVSESKSIGISSIDISRSIVDPSDCFCLSLNRSSARKTFAELPPGITAFTQNASTRVIRPAKARILRSAHGNNVSNVAERLDIIDDRRAHVEAEHCWKVRWLNPRITPLALQRFDKASFFSANVGTGAS